MHRNITCNWGDAWDPGGNGFCVLSCHNGSLLTAEWACLVTLLGQSTNQMCSVCRCWRSTYQHQCPKTLCLSPWSSDVHFMQDLSAFASSFCGIAGDNEHRGIRWDGFFFSQCVFPALYLTAAVRVYFPAAGRRQERADSIAPRTQWGKTPGECSRSKVTPVQTDLEICKQTSVRHSVQMNNKIRLKQTYDEILPCGEKGEGGSNPSCTNIFIIMQSVSVTHTREAMEM